MIIWMMKNELENKTENETWELIDKLGLKPNKINFIPGRIMKQISALVSFFNSISSYSKSKPSLLKNSCHTI